MEDNDANGALSDLENMLAEIISRTAREEEDYKAELNTQKNVS